MNGQTLHSAPIESKHALIAVAYGLALTAGYLLRIDFTIMAALSVLPLAIGILWSRPIILVLAFIGFSCFRLHEAYPVLMPMHLPLGLAVLSILAASIHLFGRTVQPFARPELVFAFLFTAHVTIGLAFAADRPLAFEYWSSNFIKAAAMCIIVAWLVKLPDDGNLISNALAFCGFLLSLVAIYNAINGIDLVEGNRISIGQELKSSISDPNDLAFVLMFAVAFSVGIFFSAQTSVMGRISISVVLVLMFWAIIATKSRGGLLGVLAVLGVYFARRYRSFMLPMLVCVVAGAALYTLADIAGRSYSNDVIGSTTLDDSSNGRLYYWLAAFQMALHRPIFGIGLHNFEDMMWSYVLIWDGRSHVAHSIWFTVLGETGFVGLALYMGMILNAFRSVFGIFAKLDAVGADERTRTFALALAAGFAGTCVAGTFLTQSYSWPVFMQVALIAALAQHVDSLQRVHRPGLAADAVERAAPVYGPLRTA